METSCWFCGLSARCTIVDDPVPQFVVVVRPISQERVQQVTVEHFSDVLVPHILADFVERVKYVPWEPISDRMCGHIVDVSVPLVVEQPTEVPKISSQDRTVQGTEVHAVDVPMPRVVEEIDALIQCTSQAGITERVVERVVVPECIQRSLPKESSDVIRLLVQRVLRAGSGTLRSSCLPLPPPPPPTMYTATQAASARRRSRSRRSTCFHARGDPCREPRDASRTSVHFMPVIWYAAPATAVQAPPSSSPGAQRPTQRVFILFLLHKSSALASEVGAFFFSYQERRFCERLNVDILRPYLFGYASPYRSS